MEGINGVLHLVVLERELSQFYRQNHMYIAQWQLLTISMVLVKFWFSWIFGSSLLLSLWAEYILRFWTMSNLGSHGGSNREALEVSSRYVASRDDIVVYILGEWRSQLCLYFQLLLVLSLWKIGPESYHRTLELSPYLKVLKWQ